MSITKKVINNNEYMFLNSCRGNRSGFVHETELYRNDRLIGTYRIQYYNRTWECYTYQTVMKGLIDMLQTNSRESYVRAWKEEHGIKRLTESKRKAMQEDFENNPPKNYAELEELYKTL